MSIAGAPESAGGGLAQGDAPAWSGSIHVLLVDDDTLARHIVKKTLEKFGYTVTPVSSAREAFQVLESTDPDTFQLILSDVVMPEGGDGLDLLEHVKKDSRWRSIPVVMMSANECIDTVRECLQNGACHYIVKPATHKEMQNVWQYAYRGSSTIGVPSMKANQEERIGAATNKHTSGGAGTAKNASNGHRRSSGSSDDFVGDAGAQEVPAQSRLSLASELTEPASAPARPSTLNHVLETHCLSWTTRLTIFCRLLHSTSRALGGKHDSSRPPHLDSTTLAFTCPASVLVSASGMVLPAAFPQQHFSTPVYLGTRANGGAANGGAARETKHTDAAQATYALGLLLLELAMAPVAPKERSKVLASLPRLPTAVLASKPNLAVLVLQMTAEDPQDRPTLAQVAANVEVAAVYRLVAAEDTAASAAAAARGAALRRAFLLRVRDAQRGYIAELYADLGRIEQDIKQVQAALMVHHKPQVGSQTPTASASSADLRLSLGMPSTATTRIPHGAAHLPQQANKNSCSAMALPSHSHAAPAADASQMGCKTEAQIGQPQSVAALPPQPVAAAGQGCTTRGDAPNCTARPQYQEVEVQQRRGVKRQRFDDAAVHSDEPSSRASPPRARVHKPCAHDHGAEGASDEHPAGCQICNTNGGHRVNSSECGSGAVASGASLEAEAEVELSRVQKGAGERDTGRGSGAPTLRGSWADGQGGAVSPMDMLNDVSEQVLSRWRHIEPVAMHMFDAYKRCAKELAERPRDGGCRGREAPARGAHAVPENTPRERAHGDPLLSSALELEQQRPCFDSHVRVDDLSESEPVGALHMGAGKRSVRIEAGGRAAAVKPHVKLKRNGMKLAPWLEAMSSDLQAVSRFRWLEVVTAMQHAQEQGMTQPRWRMVCSVALDRYDQVLAIVGVGKPVRLYRFESVCDSSGGPCQPRYPISEIRVRTKLCSSCFNPYLQNQLVVSDSEGGVMIMDTAAQHDVVQFEEHSTRVSTVDCSPHDPALVLSGSMDRTARLWRSSQESSVGCIAEAHPVCSVAFCPTNSNLIAVGTSGAMARLYDIRRLDAPLGSATAPRAVSYVRFSGDALVAASVDSVLCMYDTATVAEAASSGTGLVSPIREFRGHLNDRNFVGLACSPEGYMFTGTENNSVVMYHKSLPTPVAEQSVLATDEMGVRSSGGADAFVSCLAVSRDLRHVVSGGTTGWVNVMKLMS